MADEDPKFVDETNALIDKFEEEMAGLKKWGRKDVPAYLEMPIEELRKKTSEELAEAVYLLQQYSLNVQRLINRSKAWERCIRSLLDEKEAHYLQDVPQNYGFNERPKIARHTPEICQKLNKFLRKVQMQSDTLYDIPNHVKAVADSIRDMRFMAIKRERNHE